MKKHVLGVVVLLLCVVMLFSACNYGNSDEETTYTVTFLNYDNSLLYQATDIKEGEPAIYGGDLPIRPDTYEYTYSFIGWDKDISAIYSNLSVFAKYSETRKTGGNDLNSDNSEGDNIVATHSGEVLNKRYSAVKHSTSTEADLIDSYYDDNYYYYYFYLGEVNDVPLQSNLEAGYYHYTGNNYTKAFKTTRTTTKSVEDACTTAVTNTTTLSETDNLKAGITAKLSTKTKVSSGFATEELSAEISSNIEAGYSKTTGKNTSTSRTDSYKEVVSYSETTEETTGFEFTNESKIGYYRYIMTGSIDVYTVVIYSIADETFYLETLTEVMSRGYSFDFSESSRFDDNQCGSLEFDCSILNDLLSHIPTKALPENSDGTTPPQIDDGDTTHYAGGHGTEVSPYLIANVTHLKNIALYTGSFFKLINDIDCGASSWTPISSFSGTIDGQNHTIRNITCVNASITTATSYGFITTLNARASLQNVSFESVTITADYSGKNANGSYEDRDVSLGCVVAINRGTIKGVNVYSSTAKIDSVGSTSGDNAKRYYASVGGICGRNYGTIENCHVGNVTVLARSHITKGVGYAHAGGVVGYHAEGTISNVTASGCHIDSYVHSTSSSAGKLVSCAGGIVGAWIDGATVNAVASDVLDTFTLADYDGSAYPRTRYYYGNNGGSYIYGYKGAKFTY